MMQIVYSETDTPMESLLRGMILNSVATVRRWEEACHRVHRKRDALSAAQQIARNALDWILGDLPTDRLTFEDCCAGLEVFSPTDVAEEIVDQFDQEALRLLEVSPRKLPNGFWTVSSRPVIGPKLQKAMLAAAGAVPC